MKLNEKTKIIGNNVILVPYKKIHVKTYNKWMQCEELQKLMGVEPASLEEEFTRQRHWEGDESRCAFIILDKIEYELSGNEVDSMVGETTLQITDRDCNDVLGKIGVLIGEECNRRRKFGWEGVILTMLFGVKNIDVSTFEGIVGIKNNPAVDMFQRLQFNKTASEEPFDVAAFAGLSDEATNDAIAEIIMQKTVIPEWVEWLHSQCKWHLKTY